MFGLDFSLCFEDRLVLRSDATFTVDWVFTVKEQSILIPLNEDETTVGSGWRVYRFKSRREQ